MSKRYTLNQNKMKHLRCFCTKSDYNKNLQKSLMEQIWLRDITRRKKKVAYLTTIFSFKICKILNDKVSENLGV